MCNAANHMRSSLSTAAEESLPKNWGPDREASKWGVTGGILPCCSALHFHLLCSLRCSERSCPRLLQPYMHSRRICGAYAIQQAGHDEVTACSFQAVEAELPAMINSRRISDSSSWASRPNLWGTISNIEPQSRAPLDVSSLRVNAGENKRSQARHSTCVTGR